MTTPAADQRKRVRKSMLKWDAMDAAGRRLGRGLGRRALIARVALDVGVTVQAVLLALK